MQHACWRLKRTTDCNHVSEKQIGQLGKRCGVLGTVLQSPAEKSFLFLTIFSALRQPRSVSNHA
jgi:hypothetical protein